MTDYLFPNTFHVDSPSSREEAARDAEIVKTVSNNTYHLIGDKILELNKVYGNSAQDNREEYKATVIASALLDKIHHQRYNLLQRMSVKSLSESNDPRVQARDRVLVKSAMVETLNTVKQFIVATPVDDLSNSQLLGIWMLEKLTHKVYESVLIMNGE